MAGCSTSSPLHLPQMPPGGPQAARSCSEAASAAEPRSAVESGLQQMHACWGWGGAESRHVDVFLACVLPKRPAGSMLCAVPPRGVHHPVTWQLRLRFLRRSDEGQTFSSLKTRDKEGEHLASWASQAI